MREVGLHPAVIDHLDSTLTFTRWALCLPRWILATRTDFARSLSRSFSVKWHGLPMRTAAFPLPVPYPGCFDGGGPNLSSRRLRVLAQKRVVHSLVIALNYLYLGRFASEDELGRSPNELQFGCFSRLYDMVAACGYRSEPLPVVPGRAGAELISCIDTLERFLEESEVLSGGYEVGWKAPLSCSKKQEEMKVSNYPQLRPFRSLDVDRLKISGKGEWPLSDYLDSTLWLPFVEPAFLLHGADVSDWPGPNFQNEDRNEYLKLARKWDSLGLLRLHRLGEGPGGFCKIFNTYKSLDADRQIGDRRNINAMECSAGGPSSRLPSGPLLTNLCCPPGCGLRGSITDRRDFYHQVSVSLSRSASNMTPFGFSAGELSGCRALEDFILRTKEVKYDRAIHGDRLGKAEKFGKLKAPVLGQPASKSLRSEDELYPCFGAIYQGDHLGVEFALEGHHNLLRREGLLVDSQRLEGHSTLPIHFLWQALIIDDFFVVSAQSRRDSKEESSAFKLLAKARLAYERHALPGSPEKDVVAESFFKAAGAEIDSTEEVRNLNLCLVASPLQKRLGLALLSLRVASLEGISTKLASRLSGSWISVLMFRRCFCSVVDDLFSIGSGYDEGEEAMVVHLPRKVAQELSFLATFAPIITSDVSEDFSRVVWATDASLDKGAICEVEVDRITSKILWLGGDKKGCYTMLDNGFRSVRKRLHPGWDDNDFDEETAEKFEGLIPRAEIGRPFQLRFDFVEVCGGVGSVSHAMARAGWVVAPVLDLTESSNYDLKNERLVEWILMMIQEKKFGSVMVEPVCTSFSPAAHPACRSYAVPQGWDRLSPKVHLGNLIAFRCLAIMMVAARSLCPALCEQPRLSKMCWLSIWKWLVHSFGCEESVVASCMFGSPHRKEFRILCAHVKSSMLEKRCGGGHRHIRIEGKYTKGSAIYMPDLAKHFAKALGDALLCRAREEADVFPKRSQGESVVVNDILSSGRWKVKRDWFWKKRSHINLLEASVVTSLQKQLLKERRSGRHVVLVDSSVCKGAFSKGRSSSRALQSILKRSACLQIVGSQYLSFCFAPTRLNVPDDPTRGVPLREPAERSILGFFEAEELQSLHGSLQSRPLANWIRLWILVSCVDAVEARLDYWSSMPHLCGLCSLVVPTSTGFVASLSMWTLLFAVALLSLLVVVCACFSSCLSSSHNIISGSSAWIAHDPISRSALNARPVLGSALNAHCPGIRGGHSGLFSLVFAMALLVVSADGVPMRPETAAEVERAANRQRVWLASDRVVRTETRENRHRLLSAFQAWLCDEHGIDWEVVISRKPVDAEEVARLLVMFGRDLHASGKSYSKYSETINAVSMIRPILKKQLTSAWDLAFAWLQDEPHQHHPALPLSVAISMIALALLWGWPNEAAIIAMGFSGLLRVGEILDATRADLILPSDVAPGIRYALIRIKEPKTRGRGPRHQNARVESKDIVDLLTGVFGDFNPSQKLWKWSASTLRRRFVQLLHAVGVGKKSGSKGREYDLGSLRPGGATHLLTLTEDTALVQRRGRWASIHVMNIYLQEIAVATSLSSIDDRAKKNIQDLCDAYPEILETSLKFLSTKIPCTAWNLLFKATPVRPGKFGDRW